MKRLILAVFGGVVLLGAGLSPALEKEKTPAPSYAKDIRPFLAKYCYECHQEDKTKGGVDVTSHTKLTEPRGKKRKQAVIPGNPDRSRLLATMEGRAKQMPPRKYTQQPTREEIQRVRDWIQAGAPNDAKKTP